MTTTFNFPNPSFTNHEHSRQCYTCNYRCRKPLSIYSTVRVSPNYIRRNVQKTTSNSCRSQRLLHVNVNYNYFTFAGFLFQQTHGTAMGAAFSPTIANIFLSVTLGKFLKTQPCQPLLFSRYIDDIFMVCPNKDTVDQLLSSLNCFHPNLHFTHTSSHMSADYLDLTIYKGPHFKKN